MRSLVHAIYRIRDATLIAEKKEDFGNALQNLYRSACCKFEASALVLHLK